MLSGGSSDVRVNNQHRSIEFFGDTHPKIDTGECFALIGIRTGDQNTVSTDGL